MAQIPDAELQIEVGEIKPQKWEYISPLLGTHHSEQKDLNDWGSQGWELVTVIRPSSGAPTAYFKRPIWSD